MRASLRIDGGMVHHGTAAVLGSGRSMPGLTPGGRCATIRRKGQGHVISDIDIWRSANELIKQLGDTADIEAATRADASLNKGDLDGQRVWLRILKAVDALRRGQPRGPTH